MNQNNFQHSVNVEVIYNIISMVTNIFTMFTSVFMCFSRVVHTKFYWTIRNFFSQYIQYAFIVQILLLYTWPIGVANIYYNVVRLSKILRKWQFHKSSVWALFNRAVECSLIYNMHILLCYHFIYPQFDLYKLFNRPLYWIKRMWIMMQQRQPATRIDSTIAYFKWSVSPIHLRVLFLFVACYSFST